MKIIILLIWTVSLICGQLRAQLIDTVQIHSLVMNKDISNTIITPASYSHNTDKKYPVVYLLHGYGGNYTTWISKIKPELDQLASSLDLILVCPDGANSWYWDSPVHPDSQYETYVSKELICYIDQHYRTQNHRNGRITISLTTTSPGQELIMSNTGIMRLIINFFFSGKFLIAIRKNKT